MKAVWNNKVIAESNQTIVVENNHYFPKESMHKHFFKDTDLHTTCSLKGQASYYTLEVDGKINEDAAWYYPTPKRGYENIENYIAFWKGVTITE